MTEEEKKTSEQEWEEEAERLKVQSALSKIQYSVDDMKAKFPDFPIYISVSKEFNERLVKYLSSKDYGVRLEQLFGCRYSVSPFIDTGDDWIVGLFDYASILWQWNTFQDKTYKTSHLLTFISTTNYNDWEDWDN